VPKKELYMKVASRAAIVAAVVGTALAVTVIPARALLLPFYNLTGNSAVDAAIGEAQLSVDVTDPLGGENLAATQALFTFANAGPEACSIAGVYFDDGTLLGIAEVRNGAGVDFSDQGTATPPVLPGRMLLDPPFVTTSGFLAGAGNPAPEKGVNPGEWVGILFDLQEGQTLQNVFDDLGDRDLRIGIHVIAFADGGSESFTNVPEPATLLLLGGGLLGLAGRRRKFRN
jgi:hypothetical protein